jgi:lipoyl(octanoyl) transferase
MSNAPDKSRLFRPDRSVDWLTSQGLTPYPAAIAFMEARVEAIRAGKAHEAIWLVEHPPLYTAGTSAVDAELVAPDRFPVFQAARGGRYTYHGPGQRVAYVMLDIKARGGDLRAFVCALETWVINSLAQLRIGAEIRPGRVGVWVPGADNGFGGDAKIAAIGIRVRRMVSYHGLSVNVAPNLSHFDGIVPCGISDAGVTSLRALGHQISMAEYDAILKASFQPLFGPIIDQAI